MFRRVKLLSIISLLCIVVLGLAASTALATNYYVKPTGNDNLDGRSVNTAWQHVQKACTSLIAGDTVFIRSGVYDELSPYTTGDGLNKGFWFVNNGTPGKPIVAKGYPGDDMPIIRGDTLNRFAGYLDGKEWVVYDGLHFRFAAHGLNMYKAHYVTVRNCKIDSVGFITDNNNCAGVHTRFNERGWVTHLTVENCDISYVRDKSGWGSLNSAGIQVYACDTCEFKNNTIHHTTHGVWIKGPAVPGGDNRTSDIEISGNTFYDMLGEAGVRIGAQGEMWNIDIHNNVFWGNSSMHGAIGLSYMIFSTSNIHNVKIYNNTVDGQNLMGGIWNKSAYGLDSVEIFNNIIYDPLCRDVDDVSEWAIGNKGSSVSTDGVDSIPHYYADHNIIYKSGASNDDYYFWWNNNHKNMYTLSEWRSRTVWGDNTRFADPGFSDRANHDYTISASSPAASGGRGGQYPTYIGAFPAGGPQITNVMATDTTTNSVMIRWSTDSPTTSRVEYGYTTAYGTLSSVTSSLITDHAVLLSGLDSSTVYHYRVISADGDGISAYSGDYAFRTRDTIPPSPINEIFDPTASPTYGSSGTYNPKVGVVSHPPAVVREPDAFALPEKR